MLYMYNDVTVALVGVATLNLALPAPPPPASLKMYRTPYTLSCYQLPLPCANSRGTHIWKWRTSATKHLRCRGLSVTNCVKKGGLSVTKRTKMGSFSEMHKKKNKKKQGFSGPKWPKISQNLSTFSKTPFFFFFFFFFVPKIVTCLTIECENEGSLSDKDVSGSFGDKEFVKI